MQGSPPTDRRDGRALALSDIYNLSGSVVMQNIDVQRCYGSALAFENWPNGQVSTLIENLTVTDSARQSHGWPGVAVPPVHMVRYRILIKNINISIVIVICIQFHMNLILISISLIM
jgi:hypothetical protein